MGSILPSSCHVYLRAYWKFGTRAAGIPVSYGSVVDGELVFVPGDIPRQGVFALWAGAPDRPSSSWSSPAAGTASASAWCRRT